MASNIDATKPVTGNPTTQSVRDNFLIAKNEISERQLVRAFRITSVNDASELFQQCNVNNTPQIVSFNQVTFLQPADNSSVEFDSVNNEIIYHESGWYHVDVSIHVVRKTAGAGLATWTLHSQIKTPSSGVFINYPAASRQITMDGADANFRRFVNASFITKITDADSRLRWMQTCDDVTKTVGIIGYAAAAPLPSVPGIIWSSHLVGKL